MCYGYRKGRKHSGLELQVALRRSTRQRFPVIFKLRPDFGRGEGCKTEFDRRALCQGEQARRLVLIRIRDGTAEYAGHATPFADQVLDEVINLCRIDEIKVAGERVGFKTRGLLDQPEEPAAVFSQADLHQVAAQKTDGRVQW